jgi:hypothetical protein
MATGVKAFLDALPPDTRQLVLALRDVVRRTAPHAEESLLWGSLSYHRPQVGGRVKGVVCQFVVKGGQVRLDFIHGIRLAYPHASCCKGIGCRSGSSQSGPLRTPSGQRSQP